MTSAEMALEAWLRVLWSRLQPMTKADLLRVLRADFPRVAEAILLREPKEKAR